MSSGSWDHSNQPNVDPIASGETSDRRLKDKNREWDAVLLNETLAEIFESQYERIDESVSNEVEDCGWQSKRFRSRGGVLSVKLK